jgi:gliding motility-associated-like protein
MSNFERWRRFLLILFLVFITILPVFSQYPNVTSEYICNNDNNRYDFFSGTPRTGTWVVIEGTGTFSNPSSHSFCSITNISYGKNVYYFFDPNDNSIPPGVAEHSVTVYNTKVNAGADAVICWPTTSFQLNGSNPGTFPGSSGEWTLVSGSGVFADKNNHASMVTGLSLGANRFRWTAKSLPGGCGNSFDEIQVTVVNTPPNAFAGNDQTICPGGSATITAPAGAGYTYLWSTGETTQSITVSPAVNTNYQVTVTNSNNCTATDNVDIFINNISFYNLSSNAATYCAGGTGVTLTLSDSEIGVNYQLKIGGANDGALVAGTGAALTWTNKTAGTYTVVATNPITTCSEVMNGSVVVTADPLPTTYNCTASSATYCSHTSGVTLNLSNSENGANFKYQLYKNGVVLGAALNGDGNPLTWSNITSGNYSVVTTNTLTTCSASMAGTPSITSIVSPSIFTVGGSGIFCETTGGLDVTLDDSEIGVNYQLLKDGFIEGAPKAGTGGILTWNGNREGTYTIMATSGGGSCPRTMNSSAVIVKETLPFIFNLSSSALGYCLGGTGTTLTLSGSQMGVNYQLLKGGVPSGGIVSGDGNPLTWLNNQQGVYKVQATKASVTCALDMNGTINVVEYPLPVQFAIPANLTYCSNTSGATIELSSSQNGSNYKYQLYKNGIADGAPVSGTGAPLQWTGKTSGTYTVGATNTTTGCTETMLGTTTVSVLQAPGVFNVSGTGDYCQSTAGLAITISGSEAIDVNYQLLKNGASQGAAKPGTGLSLSWNNQLSGSYTVSAVNTVNGCITSMNGVAVLTEVPLPLVYTLSGTSKYCIGSNGVTLTLSGSQVGINYILKNGLAIVETKVGTGASISWLNVTAGNYTVEAVTTNPIACSVTMNGSVTVSATALPVVNAGINKTICKGQNIQLQASGANLYSWDNPGTLNNALIPNPIASPTSSTSYVVTGIDVNGCSNTDTVQINVRELPIAVASTPQVICNGEKAILTATDNITGNNETYIWNTGSTNDTIIVYPSTNTIYTVTITDAFGCKNSTSTDVTVNMKPGVNAGSDAEICAGSQITLNGNGDADSWLWSNGSTTLSTTVTPAITTDYILKGTYTATGCYTLDTVEITVNNLPIVSFTLDGAANTQFCSNGDLVELVGNPAGGTFSSSVAGAISGNYFNPVAAGLGSPTITYTYSDAKSCTGTKTLSVDVVAPPLVSITGLNSVYCSTDASFNLSGNPLHDGNGNFGTWTFSEPSIIGALVDNNDGTCTIKPSTITVEGNYSVTYRVANSSGCYYTATQTFFVKLGPSVDFVGLPVPAEICKNAAALTLSGNQGAAGTFTGLGITSGAGTATFNPSGLMPGIYNITFSYTDAVNSCSASKTKPITVNDVPVQYSLTGGGTYCSGTPGLAVGLSDSEADVTYELFRDNFSAGIIVAGTGNAISFGDQTIAGTYTVKGKKNGTLCSLDMLGSTVITVSYKPLDAQVITGNGSVCPGGTENYFIPVINNATYIWQIPANATITSGVGTTNISVTYAANAASGNITVYGQNACGVGATSSLTITVKSLPAAAGAITGDQAVCQNDINVVYKVPVIADATSYLWTAPSGATIVSGQGTEIIVVNYGNTALSGNVTVRGVNSCGNGGLSTLPVVVSPVPQLTKNAPSDKITCKITSVTVSATSSTAGAAYLWSAIEGGNITGVNTNASTTVNSAGRYIIAVTANGCVSRDTVSVISDMQAPQDINLTSTNSGEITCALPTLTLLATTTSTFPVGYQWTPSAGGNIVSGAGTANPVIDKGGVYEVKLSNLATECFTTRSITIKEIKDAPDVTVTNPEDEKISCSKTSVTLTGSSTTSGVTYSWSGVGIVSGGNTATPVVNATGTFTLTVTAPNGCPSTATVQVVADNSVPTINVNPNPADLTCTVGSVTLNGSSTTVGATLLWSGPGIVSGATTETPIVNQPGVYTLTVTHPLTGCTDTRTVTIKRNNTIPTVSFPVIPADITCEFPSVTITSSTSAANKTYQWSTLNGAIVGLSTNPSVVASKAGTYTLVVTDTDNGCTGSGSIVATEKTTPPDAQIAAPSKIICSQTSIQLSGSSTTTPINILWSTTDGSIFSGGNTFNPTVNKGGTYQMKITNTDTKCYSTATVVVVEDKTKPVISIDKAPAIITCASPKVTLNGTAAGATLLWTGPAGAVITNPTSPNPIVDKAGRYYLTATNALGCPSKDSTEVTDNLVKPVNITIGAVGPLTCTNSSLNVTGNSTTVSATYKWTGLNGGVITSADNAPTITINAPGDYKMVVIHPSSFCKDSATITVTQNLSAPVITFPVVPSTITCVKDTSTLISLVSPAGATLLWSGPGTISTSGALKSVVDKAGTYTLKATHPTTGCVTTSTLVVPENKTSPDFTIAPPALVTCLQPSVSVNATTSLINYKAAWSTSNGTIVGASNTISIIAKEGLYTLTLTNNNNGCFASKNVLVGTNNSAPDITVDPNPAKITCLANTVELYGTSATAGTSLLWTGPGNIIGPTTERPKVDAIGVYTLTVTNNATGCKSTGNVTVSQDKTPPAVPGILPAAPKLTCNNSTVNLELSPIPVNTDILWTTAGAGHIINEKTSIATVDAIGTYTVTLTDRTTGCSVQNSIVVTEDKSVSTANIIGGSYQISCSATSLELEGTTNTGVNPVWTTSSGGHIVKDANTLKPTIDAAGTYTFTVTNPVTGCTNSSDVVVTRSADLPTYTIDAFPAELTCLVKQVTLSGQPTEAGTTYTWTASPGNIVAGTETTFNPVVDLPGSYILTVTKTATGCKSVAAINVVENITSPAAVIAVPDQFTCSRNQVQLAASSTSTNVSAKWTTSGSGSIRTGDDVVWNPIVYAPETYTLTVTDLNNQCTAVKSIVVTEDKTAPNINVDKSPLPLTCSRTQVTLSGNSLTPNATYLWTTSGSGNISNPASKTPSVDAIGTYTLKVTNPVNGCSITDDVVVTNDLTVPQIWVNTTPSILNCARDTVYLKGSSTTANVTYLWSGPGNISNVAVKDPYVDAPGFYTLTVKSAGNGCSSTLPVTVTRNTTIPAAPLLTGNAACFGASATALIAVGNGIQWYSNPALGSTFRVQTGNSFTPGSVTTVGDYSFYATQTDPISQCESPASQVNYTIRPLPAPPVNINKTICEGSNDKTLTASGNNIKWYNTPGGAVIWTGAYSPTVSAPGTYTYYTTQTDANGCESPAKDISLTIQPIPAKPDVNQLTASVCYGNVNPVFTASGTNLNWYTSPSLPAPVKSGGSFTPLETSEGTYNYFVTQTSSFGCVSPYETLTLNIRPVPQPFVVTGGGVFCENTNGLQVGLTGSQLNTSYQLLLNGTTVVTSMNGTGAALDFGLQKGIGNYTIKASDSNTCEAMMSGGVSITSNPLPGNSPAITGLTSVCEGAENVAYSVPAIPNATSYTWTVPAGAVIASGLNTSSITVDYLPGSKTGQVSVIASNACGSGAISPNHQVIVSPLPVAAGNIKITLLNDQICLGDTGKIYEVDPITNATSYEWILPAGATVYSGANSRQIRVRFAPNAPTGTQIIRVRGVNACGKGNFSSEYKITVNPNPSVYAGIDQNLCSIQTSLQGSVVPAGGTGVWNQVLGYSAINDNSLPTSQINDISQGLNIYTWKITHNNCSSTDTVKIFNNKLNVDAGENLPICSQNITLRGTPPPAGTTGIWTVGTGSASFVNASQYNTSANNFGYGDNKLYWTVIKSGCNSRDSITITNYRPILPEAGGDQTICVSNTFLNATAPLYGTGTWSVFSGKATFTNINDPRTSVTNIGKGKNILLWTVTNMICSLTDSLIITNNELDINAGYDQVVCENRASIEGTVPSASSTGQWSVLVGSASFLDGRSYSTKVSGLVNGTNKLIWSITRGSCVNSDTVSIVCNMPSSASAGPDQFLANGNAILDGDNPVVGTGKWSIISGAANFANENLYNTATTGLNPGANILRWTITYNNCSTFDEVTITNGTIEKVDAGQDQILCTNQTTLEAARPQYGFGIWTVQKGSANFENNEAYNSRVTNLAPGTNILRWSVVVSGIEFYDTVTLVNNQPTLALTGPKQILCIDSSGLVANIPVQGIGRWTLEGGSGIIQNPLQHNSKVTGLSNGDNIFRWTITKGTCVSSALYVITNDRTTIADAGLDQTICDDKTTLMPAPAYVGTGEWSVVSGSGRFNNNEVTGLARGKNILRFTIRKNNCSSYDDMVVISNKPTTASAGLNTIVCVDSINLSANKANAAIGEFGRWSILNGSGQISDSTLNTSMVKRLAEGVNVLRWTINNNGCISSSEVQINYAYVNSVAGISRVTCDNHIILNANNPSLGKGEWSVVGGSGTAVFTDPFSPNTEVKNLDQGKNILRWTITNFSCQSSSEVIMTNNAPSEAFAGGDQSLCVNNTMLAARQPFIGNGSWSVLSGSGLFADTSSFNSRVYNVGSGSNTYRWTVRNQNCTSIDEVVISNNRPIGTYAGLDQTLCNDSTKLSANQPVVGTGVWSIVKGAGQIQNVFNAASSIMKLAPDTNIVRWTVTNKQCVEFQEIRLVNNAPTIPLAGADRTLCSDQMIMDGNNPVHGVGEWLVISGSGTFSNKNLYNSEVRGLSLGRNIFRWRISKQGCVLYDDVVLTNDLPTKPNAGTDISVCDNNASLNANKPAVGYGYWTIVSGKGTFVDSTQYNTRIVGLGQGSNLLMWTTVHNRCMLTDVVDVKNNLTNVFAGPDQIVYESSSILVGNEPLRGLGTWTLSGGSGTIGSPNNFESSVTGLAEGINTFVWSVDISGCKSSDAVQITYFHIPTASFSVNQIEGCPPLEVRFTKTTIEKYPYKWHFGDMDATSNEENPVFVYEKPGRYSAKLVVTGPDGKPVQMVKTIIVRDLPVAKFDIVQSQVYIPDEELRCFNYSSGAKTYLWDFGDGGTSNELNPAYVYKDSGLYSVKLTVWSEYSCMDSLTVEDGVHVLETSKIKFPSAFTPNVNGSTGGLYNRNDYSNDVFYPILITGDLQDYHIEIYNRWGVLIFQSRDVNVGWDGYYKEKLMKEDIYVYRVTGRLNSGKKINITGDFLLMRKDK